MSNKYTPGPWIARRMFQREAFQDFRIEGKDQERVLVLRGGTAPCEADACLIAAAPDLLAVCELLVSSAAIGTDAWPAIIAAQVAIIKAKGEAS